MPVLAKFHGIVMRMMCHRTFGTHLHAIYGEEELVIGLKPVRAIQGEVPPWVSDCALAWARRYEGDFHPPLTPVEKPAWAARSSIPCFAAAAG